VIIGFGLNILMEKLPDKLKTNYAEDYYKSVISASAIYGLIQIWIVQDLELTPHDLVNLICNSLIDPTFKV